MRTTGGRTEPIGRFAVSVPLLAAFFVLATAVPADGYRILAVETVAGKSHWNFLSAVLRSLTDAGHEVTAFTPFPDGDRENYTEVDTSGDFPMWLDHDVLHMMQLLGRPISLPGMMRTLSHPFCNSTFGKSRLGRLTENRVGNREVAGFDAIVIEPVVIDCMSYLADALNAPVIYVIPSPMLSQAEHAFTGHFSNPASVAHFMSRRAVPGTFAQRLANAAFLTYSVLFNSYCEWTQKITDPKPYDRSVTVHPSVIFQNSHYVTEAPRPVTANLVDVGGIHLKPPKIIPKDILEFIENSTHGVIYFSFGSTINMSSLPDYVENAFKNALARVPQKVLWRREKEMTDQPKNVMVRKWFPQREILLHPNIKLFIGHGGISGVYETVDAGVPTLGFPLFYDQPRNIGHLVHNGMAISMDLLSVTEDTVFNAIEELISNDKYKKSSMIASKRFKDRPMSPEQLVVYWTEYVVRHKGAPHLKSYALNLTWYQYFLLDVIGAVLLLISLTVFICYKSFKVICKYVFRFPINKKIKVA